jgi:hypothetical protein
VSLYKLGGLNIRTVLYDKGQRDREAMTRDRCRAKDQNHLGVEPRTNERSTGRR